MSGFDEYSSLPETLGAEEGQEYHMPEQPVVPRERSAPRMEEHPEPGTPDGIPARKKSMGRLLVMTVMSLSLLGIPALPGQETLSASGESVAEKPNRTSSAAAEPLIQIPLVTLPPETIPPETEPQKTDLEILLEVGTWISEDGLVYVHFDENGGWWRTVKHGDTYGRMAWQEREGHVDYSGHAVSAQLITYSDGEMARVIVNETVEGTVAVSGMTIGMQNPFGMECTAYVPAEAVQIAAPYAYYDPELPETGWHQADFSTVPEEVAEAQKLPQSFMRYCVWIEGVGFAEDTCTVTFADNFNGSQKFSFTWREAGEDELVLTPLEQLEYTLHDAAENSKTVWDNGMKELHAYLTAGENGPILCLQNPFANRLTGLDYEFLALD